jgi:hypothetical protein
MPFLFDLFGLGWCATWLLVTMGESWRAGSGSRPATSCSRSAGTCASTWSPSPGSQLSGPCRRQRNCQASACPAAGPAHGSGPGRGPGRVWRGHATGGQRWAGTQRAHNDPIRVPQLVGADHLLTAPNGYACASSARGGGGASWAQRIAPQLLYGVQLGFMGFNSAARSFAKRAALIAADE